MYCRYCGKQIEEQFRFCRYCGKEIKPVMDSGDGKEETAHDRLRMEEPGEAEHGKPQMEEPGETEHEKPQREEPGEAEHGKSRREEPGEAEHGKPRTEKPRETEHGKPRTEEAEHGTSRMDRRNETGQNKNRIGARNTSASEEWEPFVVETPTSHNAKEEPKGMGKPLRIAVICAVVLVCIGIGFRILSKPQDSLDGQAVQETMQPVQQVVEADMDYAAALQAMEERFQEYLPSDEGSACFEDYRMQLQNAIRSGDWQACGNIYAKLQETEADAKVASITRIEQIKTDVLSKLDDMTDEDLEAIGRQEVSSVQSLIDAGRFVSAKAQLEAGEHFYNLSETDEREEFDLDLAQVDVSRYPTVRLYFDAMEYGIRTTSLESGGFSIYEWIEQESAYRKLQLKNARLMDQTESLNIGICADVSASMGYDGISQAAESVCELVDCLQTGVGDRAALYSFADDVNPEIYYTTDTAALKKAARSMEMGDMTSLYDAIGYALSEIIVESGAKCVIAFTDGMENNSYLDRGYIINKANSYGIPLYLIGIGDEVDEAELKDLAVSTGGMYYHVNRIRDMGDVYKTIFRDKKSQYVLEYETQTEVDETTYRNFFALYEDSARYSYAWDSFCPADYKLFGYIFHDSDSRYLTAEDLDTLTEIEVMIALNEIYARRGYEFHEDARMIAHFNSCDWYVGGEMDMNKVYNKFNKYEKANVEFLVNYEITYNLNGRKK